MASATEISKMQNPSVVLYGPGSANIEDKPIPELGEKDVLIRIAFVGVCGSDVHFWKDGGITTKIDPKLGIVMGHEASGTIYSVGSAVSSVKPGDRVAVEPGVPCRFCKPCKSGSYHLCRKMRFAAAPPDNPGTLAKYFKSAEDFVYKIPDEVSLEEAVLVEPTAVAVHAVRLVDVRPGETVVVMGSGTIGLSCAAVAKVFGAERVVLVDILDEKLKFARAHLGVETFKSDIKATPEENASALLNQLGIESAGVGTSRQEAGVDTVLECSGAASSISAGINILRPGGKFVQTGLGKPKIEFPIMALSEKELLVRGCFRYSSGDFELAVGFLKSKVFNVKGLISSVVEFQDVTRAWDKTGSGEGIKNLVRGVRD